MPKRPRQPRRPRPTPGHNLSQAERELAARFHLACKGRSNRDLERYLSTSHESIRKYRKAAAQIPAIIIAELCQLHMISLEWLVYGHGEQTAGPPPAPAAPVVAPDETPQPEIVISKRAKSQPAGSEPASTRASLKQDGHT